VDRRVFCSAQTCNWLMEILALVDEACALSTGYAVTDSYEARYLIITRCRTASAVTAPTGSSNAMGWALGKCRTASTGMKFGVDSES